MMLWCVFWHVAVYWLCNKEVYGVAVHPAVVYVFHLNLTHI